MMIVAKSTTTIRPMTVEDISEVLEIDHLSFPISWSERSYRYELESNSAAQLLVAEYIHPDRVELVGYIGFWFVVDEVHISTLAVHPHYRRRGIGACLLADALDLAASLGGAIATLEVRTSNQIAMHLYQQFGFEVVGRRKNYYQDNREDAWLMRLDRLNGVRAATGGSGT
jgi:ribosomal-protein-alanine N-acetyltransferase